MSNVINYYRKEELPEISIVISIFGTRIDVLVIVRDIVIIFAIVFIIVMVYVDLILFCVLFSGCFLIDFVDIYIQKQRGGGGVTLDQNPEHSKVIKDL